MLVRAATYGLLAAAGGASWTLVEYALGFHTTRLETGRYSGFVAILFPILAIVFALKAARSERGALSFREGMMQGAAVTLVQATAGAVFIWLYFTLINPGFFAMLSRAGKNSNTEEQVTIMLVSSLAAGLLISVVAAALMRRRSDSSHAR